MTTLQDQFNKLQTLEQQRQELLRTISDLEQQQEELARLILHSPNLPQEAYVPIDSKTIAWIEHSDHWNDQSLRSAIQFHELTHLDFEPDDDDRTTL
ncbi:MAG: hypothetical protein KME13_23880 [Myxacorys californica WJT36-NPBG1]|jgi:hypothetical protein|nr:hypothetical protein [Myxacorys californica WJT36-NPBG1]